MSKLKFAGAVAALVVGAGTPLWAVAAGSQATPTLDLQLKPVAESGEVDHVDVRLRISSPNIDAGGVVARLPLIVASIPTARYDGDALQAFDAAGALPLTLHDEDPTPSGVYRNWKATRATQGDVILVYQAKPREVGPNTRPGPLFDLRREAGGINGSGLTFLALPDNTTVYDISLTWDLSAMAPGSSAAWSLGDGAVKAHGPASVLSGTYYAAGPLKRYPEQQPSDFAMYWLSTPNFDTDAVGQTIETLYAYMSHFFRDDMGSYRVFIRKNPYRSGGGTAQNRSFMFGYNDFAPTSLKDLTGLLAHEMVHNWPRMSGGHGETAWYSEGAADFYSIVLSYRAGLIDPEQFLKEINARASAYYTNTLRHLSNTEAGERFWTDPRAQTLPYGRGFIYLVQVDAEIRARTHGRRSLDDIVLTMLEKNRADQPAGIEQFLELVEAEIGPEARSSYATMAAGENIMLPASAFGSCLQIKPHDYRIFDPGFDYRALAGDKIARSVEPGGVAEIAGLRNGDVILSATSYADLQEDQTRSMTVRFTRDGGEAQEIVYKPRGEILSGYIWERAPGKSDADCAF